MAAKRRQFQRAFGNRSYRKMFVIATEGAKTEPQYFSMFTSSNSIIRVRCLKSKSDSAPPQVLQRMKKYLQDEGLRAQDEAWLVVDKDAWTDEQLNQLHAWSTKQSNYAFAMSNPNFELWLLLHFEDGKNLKGASDCTRRLARFLPNYDKNIDIRKFTPQSINDAITRAKRLDSPACSDWPKQTGSTVYRLVEKLLIYE